MREKTPFVSESVQVYLRDTYDHISQLVEMIDSAREMAVGLSELYLSTIGNRTNEVMKVLTLMSSVFIPLTFVAGIYGMNFENMPELRSERGYYVVLGLMIVIAIGMLVYFRRRGWLGSAREPVVARVSATAAPARRRRGCPLKLRHARDRLDRVRAVGGEDVGVGAGRRRGDREAVGAGVAPAVGQRDAPGHHVVGDARRQHDRARRRRDAHQRAVGDAAAARVVGVDVEIVGRALALDERGIVVGPRVVGEALAAGDELQAPGVARAPRRRVAGRRSRASATRSSGARCTLPSAVTTRLPR